MVDRRTFLRGVGASGLMATAGCRVFTGAKADFDENLAVLISDSHVCSDTAQTRWLYTQEEFDRRIAEILVMDPLPRNVIFLGDLAFDAGSRNDYRLARTKFRPLTDAGIQLTLGVGNHDRRLPFWDIFPETKTSPVDGKDVSVVLLSTCDFVVLDTLVGKAGAEPGGSGGALDDEQGEWLKAYLAKATRPVLVAAHHGTNELKTLGRPIVSLLKESPRAVGWINGHDHRWIKRPLTSWGAANQDTLRGLTLPSAALWGDIGWTELRLRSDGARAVLHETGYWFNDRLHADEREPDVWKAIVAENQGQYCEFPFARMMRKS